VKLNDLILKVRRRARGKEGFRRQGAGIADFGLRILD
jgi:hypothetical protein